MANLKTLVVDFDGVIHSYNSGWQGENRVVDPPTPGAMDFLKESVGNFTVAIHSTRSNTQGGIKAMQRWLSNQLTKAFGKDGRLVYAKITWPRGTKPLAFVTLDDRTVQFMGTFPSMQQLLSFKAWNKGGLALAVAAAVTAPMGSTAPPPPPPADDEHDGLRIPVTREQNACLMKYAKVKALTLAEAIEKICNFPSVKNAK